MRFLLLAGAALCGCFGIAAACGRAPTDGSTTDQTPTSVEPTQTTGQSTSTEPTTTNEPQSTAVPPQGTGTSQGETSSNDPMTAIGPQSTAVPPQGTGTSQGQSTSNDPTTTNELQSTAVLPQGTGTSQGYPSASSSDLSNGAQSSTMSTQVTDADEEATSVPVSMNWTQSSDGWPLADFAASQLRGLLQIKPQIELVSIRQTVTRRSTVVAKYQPTINNITIYDSRLTAEFYSNGTPTGSWDGGGFDVVVDGNCSSPTSTRKAFYILAQEFKVCNLRKYLSNEEYTLAYYTGGQINKTRLIYRLSAVLIVPGSSKPMQQLVALMDACSGQVIEKWNGFTALAETTIQASGGNLGTVVGKLWFNDLQVGLGSDGSCIYSTSDVQVQNMGLGTSTSSRFSPTSFTCSQAASETYDSINGGYSPLNDVARNSQTVAAMYRQYLVFLGSATIQAMLPLKARVHYGSMYANSFWLTPYAYFGDGNANVYPPTTLDIVAHELGHGFTAACSGLQYVNESGGINEAFSDMAGQAAVYFSKGEADFLPGAGLAKDGRPLRNMCNPPQDGSSIDNYSKYPKNQVMDVHYSSGLYNKAFCILSNQGGKQAVDVWFKVFARANCYYWGQKTTFNSGVCGVQKAAWDSLGQPGVDAVKSAFAKVYLACPTG